MSVIKIFVFLVILVVLGGCAATPCPSPGQPNNSDRICTYKIKITEINTSTGMVKGKVPESVLTDNIESGKKHGYSRDYSNYPRDTVYSFIVRDTSGLEVGEEVLFHRKPMSMEATYNNTLERGKGVSDHMEQGSGTIK